MYNAQNNQLLPKDLTYKGQKILKFCYFIIFCFCLISCGNDTKKQNDQQETKVGNEADENTDAADSKTILFFGDSITAGYGLDATEDAFPAVIQQKIDSLGINYTVVNSGVSGETTSGGQSRIDWILNQDIDIFILELGANDGLRGVPLSETRKNLQAIISTVKQKNEDTKIILAGMQLPPNMGQDYTTEFKELYAELAENNDVIFIPFILKNVGGIKALNQNDGIHPTAEGHKIIAQTVWDYLKPVLD